MTVYIADAYFYVFCVKTHNGRIYPVSWPHDKKPLPSLTSKPIAGFKKANQSKHGLEHFCAEADFQPIHFEHLYMRDC